MTDKIILLIPHFNDLPGLTKAISSIQESIEVDLLVIDDGSKNKPDKKDLRAYYKNSGDIHILYNQYNLGITKTLNAGLKYVHDARKYEFIARLDCGDIFYQNKLATQLSFFKCHPHLYLLGTWAKCINMQGRLLFYNCPPTENKIIKQQMHRGNKFVHVSVMFRTSCLDLVGYYPENFMHSEDYAFFCQIAKYAPVANINQVLVEYEFNPFGISGLYRRQQLKSSMRIILKYFDFSLLAVLGLSYYLICLILPQKFIFYLKKKLKS